MDIIVRIGYGEGEEPTVFLLKGIPAKQTDKATDIIRTANKAWWDDVATMAETLDDYIEMKLRESGIECRFGEYELVELTADPQG